MEGDDARNMLALPALGTEFMPKRPKPVVPISNNRTERFLPPLKEELGTAVGGRTRVGQHLRMAIMDGGCSGDTHPLDMAWQRFPQKARTLLNAITFEKANKPLQYQR